MDSTTSEQSTPPTPVPPVPPAPGRRRRRILGWVALGVAAFLVATGITAYAAYHKLYGNIRHVDVPGLSDAHRPPKIGDAVNILIIGSDSRAGVNKSYYGNYAGARSDTILVMHIAAGGKRATGVSLPRDSIVNIPACTVGGHTIPAHQGMINSSFNSGGAGCTWKTIESVTGIHLDHFVQIDFAGFQRMVDALGGIEIDLPKPVRDTDAHLDLSAGRHMLDGRTALAYVRARHAFGDGSDLGRIERQQRFMSAMISKATSKGLLSNPAKLFGFLDAATDSVTTDSALDVGEMRRLANGLNGVNSGAVRFLTVPNHPWPPDPNRVAWTQPAARHLFHQINTDARKISVPN